MPRKRKKPDGDLVPTMDAAAVKVHTTRRTLATWFNQGCPGRADGGYSVVAIDRWARANGRGQYRRGANGSNGNGEQSEKQRAELRILQAKASRLELELQVRAGELVDVGEALRESARFHATAREHLQQMASRVLALFPPAGAVMQEGDHKRVRDDVGRVADTVIEIFRQWFQQRAQAARKGEVQDDTNEDDGRESGRRPTPDRAGRGTRLGGEG